MKKLLLILFLFSTAYGQSVVTLHGSSGGGGTVDSATYATRARAGKIADSLSLVKANITAVKSLTRGATWPIENALGSTSLYSTLGKSQADITTTVAFVDAVAKYAAVYITETTTLTGVKWWQTVQGSYTADNNNKVCLYSSDGTTLTLVASSTDDGNLWKGAANAMQSKAFSSTYSAAPGQYYIFLLYNSSGQTTAPSLGGYATFQGSGVSSGGFANSGLLMGTKTATADAPSTILFSAITVTGAPSYATVY